jgi:aminopeptidase N
MTPRPLQRLVLVLALGLVGALGCGGGGSSPADGGAGADAAPGDRVVADGLPSAGDAAPAMDFTRDILATDLALDLTARTATAQVTIAGSSTSPNASFEIGDLTITGVRDATGPLRYSVVAGPPRRVDVVVPPSSGPAAVTFDYQFTSHPSSGFDGWMATSGVSFLWPYFCGNLFPCKSAPDDGTTFTATVTGVPSGATAVFPATIPGPAPSYMFAVAVGSYSYHEIGVTAAGTHVGVYTLPGDTSGTATARLRDIFNWYEQSLGAYTFGDHVASVAANWGPGDYGGMEHHPLWHVGTGSMGIEETHAHEAAHGWYGNGIRLRCWEDFVLSEGTATYLAAAAITAVGGAAAGTQIWNTYAVDLEDSISSGDTAAYPDGCNQIDILNDPLWSGIPYYKGAFFYKAVAAAVGADALLAVLARFYVDHVGQAATMQEMLDAIHAQTGFDPTALANGWLRSLGHP